MCDQACNKCSQGCEPVTDLDVAEAVPPLTKEEVEALRSILKRGGAPVHLIHEGGAVVPKAQSATTLGGLPFPPLWSDKPISLEKGNPLALILAELQAIRRLLEGDTQPILVSIAS
ncbi:hypothetical protein PSQ39_21345 [Curvibacter sp. HBC28]|uniref:Uncharacterized protein n=1 Tax=Curvibacter microcysteis TaxID=3026419 RepID=A0ABT5MKU6_9BURK|nr:hypothetical protein [Curvibacter sp. HBC28]MDD0817194.1 hypothetical protein [Curvibacter sp. HBC28]